MKLLASRDHPVINYQTLAECVGYERLFRMPNGQMLLYMSSDAGIDAEERVIWLSLRDAISWLNQTPDSFGSFWEEAGPVQSEVGALFGCAYRR